MNNTFNYLYNFYRRGSLLNEFEDIILKEEYIKDSSFNPDKKFITYGDAKLGFIVKLETHGYFSISFGNIDGDIFALNNIGIKGLSYVLSRIYDSIINEIFKSNDKFKKNENTLKLKGLIFEGFKSETDIKRKNVDALSTQRSKAYLRFIKQIMGDNFSYKIDDIDELLVLVDFKKPIELGSYDNDELTEVLNSMGFNNMDDVLSTIKK